MGRAASANSRCEGSGPASSSGPTACWRPTDTWSRERPRSPSSWRMRHGIRFAIPIQMLKEVAPQLEKGHMVRSWMGMTVQDQLGPDLAEWFGVPGGKGVVITDVIDGGPAARAGLRPGDIVVSFEGDPIIESYRLRWLTANASPGRTVKM